MTIGDPVLSTLLRTTAPVGTKGCSLVLTYKNYNALDLLLRVIIGKAAPVLN
jgi:hypothetical protein